jgi:hypothetical protein
MKSSLLAALFVALMISPVLAAGHEEKPAGHGKADAKTEKKADKQEGLFASQDNLVPLPTVIAPVVMKDTGRLTGHLYFFLAALTADAGQANEVKKRLPYVQDAMLREAYREKLVVTDSKSIPDSKALIEQLKNAANQAVGSPVITELKVGRIDAAPY